MMKGLLFSVIFLTVLNINAQTRVEKIGEFRDIKVYDGLSVTLVKSKENKIIVTGEDTDRVAFVNRNGTLKIRMKIDFAFSGYRTFVEVHHTGPMSILDANENSKISSKGTISQVELSLKSQEGAEIDVDVDIKNVTAKAVTKGKIKISGKSVNQDIYVNSGGEYFGNQLNSDMADVNVSAGGMAEVTAKELIKAKVKAGGTIKVKGVPKVLDKQIFLGGNIIEE